MVSFFGGRIKFDRNELAGAFGDIGTDLPLIIGMIIASGLNVTNVLVTYGSMQLLTAFIYGIPMPVQPLKAVAMIVISQKVSPEIIYGGGLAIGLFVLVLSLSGIMDLLAKIIPKVVVRGIQMGLGINLALTAMKDYIPAESINGYFLAFIAFSLVLLFLGNRKYPPAIFIIVLGIMYAVVFNISDWEFIKHINLTLPSIHVPQWSDMVTGFLLLALPQIPLSIGNSIIATKQIANDYFPQKKVSVKKISLTYSIINILNPFLGGIPTCHGSGGIAGHYTFGARTGGSVFLYGSMYLIIGLFFSEGFEQIIKFFPLPILGIILFFEGLALIMLMKDILDSKRSLMISFIVALSCIGLKFGFLIGMILGVVLYYTTDSRVKNTFKFKITFFKKKPF
ncbi:MAG TPA: putative sulfate/molybdate transporter [Bacteroidales bacterium]|jgi:MFS superfamily sulfate permease-like transporter|nr:putative sulfate/molybdate transporter [Bacteroidales bacterium]HOU97924.1 putative sulfate/molybdate transporter [Bacteroidales bacterium]